MRLQPSPLGREAHDRPRPDAGVTCGVVVGHPAALDADFNEGLQPLGLPVPHADAHRLGGRSKPGTYVGWEILGFSLLLQYLHLWQSDFRE